MKFGSLFSGVGGFDLGFERAGMECAWQAERDKFALQVLNTHWPNILKYEDVKDVGRNAEPVDLICGGFPCQDLSVAGKRAGLAGERSGLWFEFRRIIEGLAPTWVVIENVPGLLSSSKGRDMAVLLGGLAQLGYGWAYRVLDSQYFGVAQRRRRVFIVGHIGDATAAAKVLFEPESRDWDSAPRREKGQSYSFSAGASPAAGSIGWQNEQSPTLKSASGGNSVPAAYIPEIARAITSGEVLRQKVDQDTYMVEAMDVRNLRSNGEVSGTLASKKSGGYSLNYQNPVAFHPRRTEISAGELAPTQNTGNGGSGAPAIAYEVWHENQGGNLSVGGETAKALKAGASKSYQGVGVRRLTPVECERLQGFPDNFTLVKVAGMEDKATAEGVKILGGNGRWMSDTQRYKMMGNAVTVNVAEWIARRIMAVA